MGSVGTPSLSYDDFFCIFRFLTAKECCECACVSKLFNEISNDNDLWRFYVSRDFPWVACSEEKDWKEEWRFLLQSRFDEENIGAELVLENDQSSAKKLSGGKFSCARTRNTFTKPGTYIIQMEVNVISNVQLFGIIGEDSNLAEEDAGYKRADCWMLFTDNGGIWHNNSQLKALMASSSVNPKAGSLYTIVLRISADRRSDSVRFYTDDNLENQIDVIQYPNDGDACRKLHACVDIWDGNNQVTLLSQLKWTPPTWN